MAYNFTDVVFSLKGLHPTDKLVLLHLAEHADKETGECWPGFGRLADFTGLTRRTVIYSINRLGGLGVVCNHGMGDITCGVCGEEIAATGRKTNTYIVRMDKLVAASVASFTDRPKRKYERTGKYRGVKAKRDRTGKYSEGTGPEIEFSEDGGSTTAFSLEDEDDFLPATKPEPPPPIVPKPVPLPVTPVPKPVVIIPCPMPHCEQKGPESEMEKHKATRNYKCNNCYKPYHTSFEMSACSKKDAEDYVQWRKDNIGDKKVKATG